MAGGVVEKRLLKFFHKEMGDTNSEIGKDGHGKWAPQIYDLSPRQNVQRKGVNAMYEDFVRVGKGFVLKRQFKEALPTHDVLIANLSMFN